jgi:hypothetical protein
VVDRRRTTRRRSSVWATAFLALAVAGCTVSRGPPSLRPSEACAAPVCTVSDPQLVERQHQQARDDLQRWADAVAAAGGQQGFVMVGDATGQIGDWEVPVGSNNKLALMSGKVVAVVGLSDETPPAAKVHWKDGSVQTLPTISAAQALKDLQAAVVQACLACDALQVTAATLTTAQIQTSRGPASVPAWEFSLRGTAVHVTRVAIAARANVRVTPPAWDPNDPPVGLSIWSASGTVGGRQLTVNFVGAPKPGSQPCGADYTAEAVESQTAVVVIIIEHNNATPGICELGGATRTAVAQLAAPLGDRAVLEVRDGLPVPVTLAP